MSPFTLSAVTPLDIEFDRRGDAIVVGGDQPALHLPVPRLGGDAGERLFADTLFAGEKEGVSLRTSGGLLLGCATEPVGSSIKQAAQTLYRRVIAATHGHAFYRIWNYVPAINANRDGAETYHGFCEGRSQAFEAALGAGFKRALPSASAVGCSGSSLALVFVAGRSAPQHLENPEQVPAYDYPREHGPRPPSFSRATLARVGQQRLLFVSGTAAIKGHATIGPGELQPQLDCTLDNLTLVSRAAGLGAKLAAGGEFQRHFKVYVRDPRDYAAVRERLERELIEPGDRAIYLQADICRAALKVEIEASLIQR